jgi:Rap1a immunity proteins
VSANYFLPGCRGSLGRENTPTWTHVRCLAFIQGLLSGVGGKETCPPKEVTGGQAVAVIIKYIEARPERMHEQFGDLALEALTAAWPCKR